MRINKDCKAIDEVLKNDYAKCPECGETYGIHKERLICENCNTDFNSFYGRQL